jgi:hypothetical protein
MSNDRYADFRKGMSQKDSDPNISGLKKEPRNNRKIWDNPPSSLSSKKKMAEEVLPIADPAVVEWLDKP